MKDRVTDSTIRTISSFVISILFIIGSSNIWADADPHAHHKAMLAMKNKSTTQTQHIYKIPELLLTDKNGKKISTTSLFSNDKTQVLDFIFTTCNTICPVLSGTFSQLDKKLAAFNDDIELISISIDPEFDTPNTLKKYGKQFNSSDHWKFYTGARDDIIKLQTAFNAYRGSKMNHIPITFVRKSKEKKWTRVDGFASSNQLTTLINR